MSCLFIVEQSNIWFYENIENNNVFLWVFAFVDNFCCG